MEGQSLYAISYGNFHIKQSYFLTFRKTLQVVLKNEEFLHTKIYNKDVCVDCATMPYIPEDMLLSSMDIWRAWSR